MTLFLFWYCFDDHLAEILNAPALGHVPWWVILLIGIVIDGSAMAGSRRAAQ